MRPYVEILQLRELVLEESYVLGITAIPGEVTFELDVVLAPGHAQYSPPTQGEQCCFRRGFLSFKVVTRLVWSNSGSPPAVDASGEADYGHIDSFEWDEAGAVLDGDWGRMEVVSSSVEVTLQ
jgi:hypothetical protein